MVFWHLIRSSWTELGTFGLVATCVRFARIVRRGIPHAESRHLLGSPSAQAQQKCTGTDDPFFAVSHHYYLCQTLSPKLRLKAAWDHYNFVDLHIDAALLNQIAAPGLALWSASTQDHQLEIRLMLGNDNMYEGGLSAVFLVDDQRVGVMSFSIVDGADFGVRPGPILLLCRNQTTSDRWYQKALQDNFKQIALSYMMLAAVAGVGQALGKEEILAICEDVHPAFEDTSVNQMKASYSEFWAKYGATPLHSGIVRIGLPLATTPLDQVQSNHRRRAKTRRAVMNDIASASQKAFGTSFKFSATANAPGESGIGSAICLAACGAQLFETYANVFESAPGQAHQALYRSIEFCCYAASI